MRGRVAWWVFAGVAYVGWLLVTLPLAPLLQAARSAGVPLQVYGESGNVWSGQAQQLVIRNLALGDVRWGFAPTDLLRGRLAFDVGFRDGGGAGVARLALGTGGRLVVTELSGKLAAQRVEPLLPMPLGLAGDLVFDDLSLVLRNGRPVAAQGQLRWVQAAVQSPVPVEIGAVELQLEEGDQAIQGRYKGDGPAFALSGTLSADAEQGYRTDTLLTPHQQEITDWLQGMGQPRVGKAFRFVYTGNW